MRYQSPIAQALSESMLGVANTFASQPSAAEQERLALENEYLQSQIGVNTQKTRAGDVKLGAPGKLADTIRGILTPQEDARPAPDFVGPLPQMSRDTAFQNALPDMVQYGMEGDIAGQLPDLNRMLVASGGGGKEALDRAMLGAGSSFAQTQGGFDADQTRQVQANELDNQTSRRGQDVTASTSRRGQDLSHQASIYATDESQAGQDRRMTVNTPANTITTLAPGNPLGPTKIEGMTNVSSGAQTPRNYITPDGLTGMTYDGKTDLNDGTALPPKTQLSGPRGLGGATEAQGKNAGYALRMEGSMKTLATLPKDFNPTELAQFLVADTTIPLTSANIGNYVVDPEYQQFLRAARDLAALILRGDSGAAVTREEVLNYGLRYLPAPGDQPPVLKDKADAIARAYGGFVAQAGPALAIGRKAYDEVAEDPDMVPAYLDEETGSDGAPNDPATTGELNPDNPPEDSKVVNGVYYEKHNGQWYEAVDDQP